MFPMKRQKDVSSRKWCIFVHLSSLVASARHCRQYHCLKSSFTVHKPFNKSSSSSPSKPPPRPHGSMAVWQYGTMALWHHGTMAPWQYGTMTAGSNHKADPDKLHLCQTEPPTVVVMKMIISMILIAILWDMLKQIVA